MVLSLKLMQCAIVDLGPLMSTTAYAETNTVNRQEIPLQPASEDIWQRKYQLKNKHGEDVDLCVDRNSGV